MASKDQDAAIIAVIGMLSGMSPNCANVVHTPKKWLFPPKPKPPKLLSVSNPLLPPKDDLGENGHTLPQAAMIQAVPEALL